MADVNTNTATQTQEQGNGTQTNTTAIMSTEFKAIADKPYKKRTQLIVSLLSEEEV